MISDSFVYRWRNQQTRMWYIGYHKGTTDDGYICSSPTVRPLIQQNPEQWRRRILRSGSRSEMVQLEHRLLKKLQAQQNPRSYNQSLGFPVMSANSGRRRGGINNPEHPDLHPDQLKKLDHKQLTDLFLSETQPERRYLLHRFLFKRIRI